MTYFANQVLVDSQILKLKDYIGMSSDAVGINLISMLSTAFVIYCITMDIRLSPTPRGCPKDSVYRDNVWIYSLYASFPSLSLLLFATQMSAIGDRAWQFSLIILISLSASLNRGKLQMIARSLILTTILIVGNMNVLFRYPLSNFFSPPIPYVPIDPTWILG